MHLACLITIIRSWPEMMKLSPSSLYFIVFSLLFIAFSNQIPVYIAHEFAVLENIQLVIIFLCLIYSLFTAYKRKSKEHIFWLGSALFFLIVGLREISYFRDVIYQADDIFLWGRVTYREFIRGIMIALSAITVFCFIKGQFWKLLLTRPLEIEDFILLLVFYSIAGITEAQFLPLSKEQELLLEEFFELLFYMKAAHILTKYAPRRWVSL